MILIIFQSFFLKDERIGCDPCTGEECEWLDAHNRYRGMVDPPATNMAQMVKFFKISYKSNLLKSTFA